MKQSITKLSLFVLGSFSFGWVLGSVLHELGHAISMWVTGGIVDRITITPFSWSYTYYGSTPKYPDFTTWSGVLLGTAMGLVILFAVTRRPTAYAAPFYFASIAPIINGGGYYLVDIFISKKGDPTRLIERGTPIFIVLGAGIVFAILGIYLLIRNLHLVGIAPNDPFIKRVIIMGFGVIPYFQASALYSMIFEPEEALQSLVAFVLMVAFVPFVAFASKKIPKHREKLIPVIVEWRHVTFALVLGISAIVVPFLMFGH